MSGIRLYLNNGVLSPNISLLSYGYKSRDEIVVDSFMWTYEKCIIHRNMKRWEAMMKCLQVFIWNNCKCRCEDDSIAFGQ